LAGIYEQNLYLCGQFPVLVIHLLFVVLNIPNKMHQQSPLLLLAVLAIVLPASTAPTSCKVNGKKYDVNTVLTKDIAIIGGGSAGTYSAIRLRDSGKSVVVIEGTDRLGGHTQTYIEPNTGAPLDYGVQVWHNFPEVTNYFNRLNVAYTVAGFEGLPGVTAE
jgi:hypothetical protein